MRSVRVLAGGWRASRSRGFLAVHSTRDYHQSGNQTHDAKWWRAAGSTAAASALLLGYLVDQRTRGRVFAAAHVDFGPKERPDLPTYKLEEVKKHGKDAERVWVTYKDGVYDVTDFVESHPGGDKILLAAGGSVDPFWSIYAQHKTNEVREILETLRIGNVNAEDFKKLQEEQKKDEKDPFNNDPRRHPALIVNSERPFNAETPPSLILDNFRTPNDIFFVRNHMPVPEVKEEEHVVVVEGEGIRRPIRLSVEQLKMDYEPHSIVAVVQCAGNRRNDMNDHKKVNGLMWTGTAISNAKWTGARLRDILLTAGINPKDPNIKHVQFEGADHDISGQHYGASISFQKAMSPETIIAYQMNDEDLPRDHGYPLRLVAPGIVGARQVKWITGIKTSNEESHSHWQKKDYRAFSPSVESSNNVDWDSVPAIQEYPVQSAIMEPPAYTKVQKEETITMRGYAWSGGGRGIIRVDVSADEGKTWHVAELTQDPKQNLARLFLRFLSLLYVQDTAWAWTFWKAEIPLPKDVKPGEKVVLVCKATDRAYNTQPETAAGLWNIRGLLHNAWHRIPVMIVD